MCIRDSFTSQLKMLGYGFDWDRCIDTTDPSYYKWTHWIFQQMFKRGLAYKTTMPVNWCTSCKCVLANEEVVNGVCAVSYTHLDVYKRQALGTVNLGAVEEFQRVEERYGYLKDQKNDVERCV